MLKSSIEPQQGLHVPYPEDFEGIRENNGFLDLRGNPDLAAQIVEAGRSISLKNILVNLAKKDSAFFSVGCDARAWEDSSANKNEQFVGGSYIQIMHSSYEKRTASDYCGPFVRILESAIRAKSEDYHWTMKFSPTDVVFNLDGYNKLTYSMFIWFSARSDSIESAMSSRDILLDEFHEILLGKDVAELLNEWRIRDLRV